MVRRVMSSMDGWWWRMSMMKSRYRTSGRCGISSGCCANYRTNQTVTWMGWVSCWIVTMMRNLWKYLFTMKYFKFLYWINIKIRKYNNRFFSFLIIYKSISPLPDTSVQTRVLRLACTSRAIGKEFYNLSPEDATAVPR